MQNASRILEYVTIKPGSETEPRFHSTITPKSFCLGGLKINAQFDSVFFDINNCPGHAHYASQEITIDPSSAPLQPVEQVYGGQWIFYLNQKMGRWILKKVNIAVILMMLSFASYAEGKSFCERVNSAKDVAIALTGVGAGVVGGASATASAAGVTAVTHSSGAIILTGTGGYISGTLASIGATSLAVLTAPVTITAAAVSVASVGGAVYYCSE